MSDWSSYVCSSDLDLADAIVDLVRAGVVEFLALEVDFGAVARGRAFAQRLGQPFGIIERAGAADIMFEQLVELGPAGGVGLGGTIFALEIEDQRHPRLGDVAAAERADMPARAGVLAPAGRPRGGGGGGAIGGPG